MTDARHADHEALSAFVDGEAPEWADHVAGCSACAAAADRLRAVAAAVAAPVEPPPAAVREAALAAALGDGRPRIEVGPARPARRGFQRQWALGAVAALFVVVVGVAALLHGSGGSSNGRTTVAGPALKAGPEVATRNGAAADSAAPVAPVTDLGDVADAASLLARARPALGAATSPAAPAVAGGSAFASGAPGAPGTPGVGGAGGAGGNAVAVGGSSGPTSPSGPVPAPNNVGTRPCEEQARARQPSLGPVVYFATARRQGVPAVVLGFSGGPAPAPVTLLLLAQDGCGELLRAVGP